ncbi:RND family efflux transporter, MFP subunit [Desulfacinum hydrothermale DSM 13146]|uniref:RND family efflux transporter, MFP subunit n=1 Tax=Desulfacinum hydrothermale DSM 13146 TaxID=1121390 RepID=A0A1W1XQA7_9BACT|nr:efflux RND transporter periplasmic adaptor subunit [Desulfacinum hydrothermale]SMC25698.1 RND family efflux transporter, MFP subunit [Desulfacinum hydrothermale DSM 13146]
MGTKRLAKRILLLGILFLVIVGLALGVKKARQRLASAPRWKPRPVPVQVDKVSTETLRDTLRYLGYLEAAATASVAPRITAVVVNVHVDEGDTVQAGDLLVELDDRDIQAEVRALSARVEALKAKLTALEASIAAARRNVSYLRTEFQRDQKLYEKKGISASALDASRNRLDTAVGRLDSLVAELSSVRREMEGAKAQRQEASTRLSYARIVAPISGVVTERIVDPGDLAKPGQALLELMDCSSAKIVFEAVQEDLGFLQPGKKVLVRWPEGMPHFGEQAVISRVFPALQGAKSVRVEADIPWDCSEPVRPGSYLPLDVVVREGTGMVVARRAVVETDGTSFVFAVRSGRLEKVPVRVIFMTENRALVEGKLREGEQVAVGEYLQWIRLHEGMPVVQEVRS